MQSRVRTRLFRATAHAIHTKSGIAKNIPPDWLKSRRPNNMARTPKQGGLVALCTKHGITDDQLFAFVGNDIKERTLWDWTKTKPIALETLIMGVAQQLGTVALTDAEGCTHYTTRSDLEKLVTSKIGEGWQMSDDAIWDSNDNRVFLVKQLGIKPALVF